MSTTTAERTVYVPEEARTIYIERDSTPADRTIYVTEEF